MNLRHLAFGTLLLFAAGAGPAAESAGPKTIYLNDARPLNQLDLRQAANAIRLWDHMHLLAALQGLANRHSPQLYFLYCRDFGVETDQFWLDWACKEDGWLKSTEVQNLASLEAVVSRFRPVFRGLAVYDPAVPATANLASTAAGCEDLLPVRYDRTPGSLYQLLVEKLKIPVGQWLLNLDGTSKFTGRGLLPDSAESSSGSAKIDAYRWALKRFLGKCDPTLVAYYIDSFWLQHPTRCAPDMHTLSNHDYFIARRAFFFDLSTWADETPTDDPLQPIGADYRAFKEVMSTLCAQARGQIIKVGGFTPWPYKYTSHSSPPGKHDGVPTEWEFGRLISQFNGYMEADAAGLAAIANASFFMHYPLAARYSQPNARPNQAAWRNKGYVSATSQVAPRFFVSHYVGDYDAPSWLYRAVPSHFQNPSRGKVPLGWAFNPNLADRAPQALVYAYTHATTNDFFITGDSGAGYLNVRSLTIRPDSGLPPGLAAWITHCQKYFARWDMTITGFMLDGAGGAATDLEFSAYQPISPEGIGTHFERAPSLHAGIPTCPEKDLPDSVEKAAEFIASQARQKSGQTGFLWARSILKSPQWYADLSDILKKKHADLPIEIVDPFTFFGLIALRCQAER
jgi:hypothetical protein